MSAGLADGTGGMVAVARFVWPVVNDSMSPGELFAEARERLAEAAIASRLVLPDEPQMTVELVPGAKVAGSGGATMCVIGTVPGVRKMEPRGYWRTPRVAGLVS